jgi:Domain of unknown function (DUF4189)
VIETSREDSPPSLQAAPLPAAVLPAAALPPIPTASTAATVGEKPTVAAVLPPITTGPTASDPHDDEFVAMALSPRSLTAGKQKFAGWGTSGTQEHANEIALNECRAAAGFDDCVLINAGMFHGCVSYAVDQDDKAHWASGAAADPEDAKAAATTRLGTAFRFVVVQCSTPPGKITASVQPAPPPVLADPVDGGAWVAGAVSPLAISQHKDDRTAMMGGAAQGATQQEASAVALKECAKETGNSDCELLNYGVRHACIAYMIDPATGIWAGGSGPTLEDAIAAASRALGAHHQPWGDGRCSTHAGEE